MLTFIHIPKTAGTSLRRALEASKIAERLIVLEREENLFLVPYEDYHENSILFGHISWRFAKLVAGASSVTLLRDPLVRCLSQIAHWFDRFCDAKETSDDGQLKRIIFPEKDFWWNVENLLDRTDMPQFRTLSNAQTAQLADHHIDRPDNLNENWLELAMNHVEQCEIVGVTESYDQFLTELSRVTGEKLQIEMSNVGSKKSEDLVAALPCALRLKLLRHNAMDTELYQQAANIVSKSSMAPKFTTTISSHKFNVNLPILERPKEFEAWDGDLRLRICQFLIDIVETQGRFGVAGAFFLDRLALSREAALIAQLARGTTRIFTNETPEDLDVFTDIAAIGPGIQPRPDQYAVSEAEVLPASDPSTAFSLALIQGRQPARAFTKLSSDVLVKMEPGGLAVVMNAMTSRGAHNFFGAVSDIAKRNDMCVAMVADSHALLCGRRWSWLYQALFRAKFNDREIVRTRVALDDLLEMVTDY